GEGGERGPAFACGGRERGREGVPLTSPPPRPGPPRPARPPMAPTDALRAIAIFRLVFPEIILRYAGGRELVLRDLQALGLVGGVNGMIVGNYLTTAGRPAGEDVRLVEDLGMSVRRQARRDVHGRPAGRRPA